MAALLFPSLEASNVHSSSSPSPEPSGLPCSKSSFAPRCRGVRSGQRGVRDTRCAEQPETAGIVIGIPVCQRVILHKIANAGTGREQLLHAGRKKPCAAIGQRQSAVAGKKVRTPRIGGMERFGHTHRIAGNMHRERGRARRRAQRPGKLSGQGKRLEFQCAEAEQPPAELPPDPEAAVELPAACPAVRLVQKTGKQPIVAR